jgi:hypothetical protein
MLHDTEFSMGIYSDGSIYADGTDPFQKIKGKGDAHSQLFLALLANASFRTQFRTVMLHLRNNNFAPSNFNPKLDYYANKYRPLMQDYRTRWGCWDSFDSRVNNARNYLNAVYTAMPDILDTHVSP